MVLTEKIVRELKEALTKINVTDELLLGRGNAAHVAQETLRAMYAELCDRALYTLEHDDPKFGAADCDMGSFEEWGKP